MTAAPPEAARDAYEAHWRHLGKIPLGWDRLLPEARAAWKAALEAAAPLIAAAERERIRLRLITCRECGEVHGFADLTTNHSNRAPWVPAGADALTFLDALLGDGELP